MPSTPYLSFVLSLRDKESLFGSKGNLRLLAMPRPKHAEGMLLPFTAA